MNEGENDTVLNKLFTNGITMYLGGVSFGLKMQWYWMEGGNDRLEAINRELFQKSPSDRVVRVRAPKRKYLTGIG